MRPVLMVCLLLFLSAATLLADSSPDDLVSQAASVTDEQSRDARLALQAMALSLRSVKSGVCRIQCRFQYDVNQAGQGKPQDIGQNLLIAFDKNQDLYRYDDLETEHTGRPNQTIVRPEIVTSSPADWKITGGTRNNRMVTRQSRSEIPNPFDHHRDPFFTVLGNSMSNGILESQVGALDRFMDKKIPESKVIRFDSLHSTGRVMIVLMAKNPQHNVSSLTELILDSNRAYIPVRVVGSHNGTKGSVWTTPDVTETEWTELNGVFVPQNVTVTGTTYRDSHLTFAMDWEGVNESLAPDFFSEKAFELKKGDWLIAQKGDQVVVEKVFGTVPLTHPGPKPVDPGLRTRYWTMIVLNLVFFAGLMLYIRMRRRSTGRG